MLRLPAFELAQPETIEAACALFAEHGERAMIVAADSDGDGRLFPPDAPDAESYLGSSGLALIMAMRDRPVVYPGSMVARVVVS